LLRPLKEAVGANAAVEPTRREASASFMLELLIVKVEIECVRVSRWREGTYEITNSSGRYWAGSYHDIILSREVEIGERRHQ
jgi:hypothetical protein